MHLAVADPWVQQEAEVKSSPHIKVSGNENLACLLTKALAAHDTKKYMSAMGFESRTGRTESAPLSRNGYMGPSALPLRDNYQWLVWPTLGLLVTIKTQTNIVYRSFLRAPGRLGGKLLAFN